MALNDKQEMFCREYLIDLNATQAAIRAGYSERTANEQGSQLLSKLSIRDRISELIQERNERNQVDADYVLRQAVKVHKRCMQEVRPKTLKGEQVYDENLNAVYEFNASGALKALELIGKHVDVQAFRENVSMKTDSDIDKVAISKLNNLSVEVLREIKDKIEESRND